MSININEQNLEQASNSAGSGFDTKGPILKESGTGQVPPGVKKFGVGPAIILAVVIVVGSYTISKLFLSPVRNCIASIGGGAPECSDCSSTSMQTNMNGRSLGKCTANPATGDYDDVCTLNCSK